MTQTIELGSGRNNQPTAIQFKLDSSEDIPVSSIYVIPAPSFGIPIDETTKVNLVRVAGEKETFNVPTVGFMTRMIVSNVAIEGPLAMATLIPEFHNSAIENVGISIVAAHFVVKSGVGLALVLPGESYVVTVDFSASPILQPPAAESDLGDQQTSDADPEDGGTTEALFDQEPHTKCNPLLEE